MKKIITLCTLAAFAGSAFAVEYNAEDNIKAYRTSFVAQEAYLNSCDSGDMAEVLYQKIQLGLGAFHKVGKEGGVPTAEVANQKIEAAKELFYANLDKLTDSQIYVSAKRIGDFKLAATKLEVVKSMSVDYIIDNTITLYTNKAISKEVAIELLVFASTKDIKDNQFALVTKAIAKLPRRDNDGKAFMSRDQKKEFYGNFIDLNIVTPASADFLGACVTQYNLVK